MLGRIPTAINFIAVLVTLKVVGNFFFFLRGEAFLSPYDRKIREHAYLRKKEMVRQAWLEMREHPRDSFTSLCSVNCAMKCNLVEVKTPERHRQGMSQSPKSLSLLQLHAKILKNYSRCKLWFVAELAKAYVFCLKLNAFLL